MKECIFHPSIDKNSERLVNEQGIEEPVETRLIQGKLNFKERNKQKREDKI